MNKPLTALKDYKTSFTPALEERIQAGEFSNRKPRVDDRTKILARMLFQLGMSTNDISELLDYGVHAVRKWVKVLQPRGIKR